MYSRPSFVICGLKEINRTFLCEILVALAENSSYWATIHASEASV